MLFFYFNYMDNIINDKSLILGLMSGTSMDGLDISCARYYQKNNSWTYELIASETIPYDNKEYSKLKNDLKELCKKNACNFFNLETIVPDKLWGLKSSTSLLRDKKEIDFMHFKYGGHEIMSKKFLEILTNFYTF